MYYPKEKCDFSGNLILAVPSEGCLGQRVVDKILEHELSFGHVGTFDHDILQPMVGFIKNGRIVTSMELYWSDALKVGIIQLRSPPFNKETFCDVFQNWFTQSGITDLYEKFILIFFEIECNINSNRRFFYSGE